MTTLSQWAHAWAPHALTNSEREAFQRDGYIVLSGCLQADHVNNLLTVVDQLTERYRSHTGYGPREQRAGSLQACDRMNLKDCAVKDPALLQLLHWPTIFPKVCGILGWNIQLYHSQLVVAPSEGSTQQDRNRPGWHRDSGMLNADLETDPQPRISLKAGIYLSDNPEPGYGNLYVLPGSHLRNAWNRPEQGDPDGAVAVCARAGDVVLFDRRLVHRASPNHAELTRKILFYGYSYRWLRPRSDIAVGADQLAGLDRVQRQLLSIGCSNISCTSPLDEEVPVKAIMHQMHAVTAVRS